MKNKLLASAVTLGLTSGTLAIGLNTPPAQASITMWDAQNSLGWCSWQPTQVDGSIFGAPVAGNLLVPDSTDFTAFGGCAQGVADPGATLPDTLSWGTEGVPGLGRSQLVLNNSNGVDINPFDPTGTPLSNPAKLTAGAGFADPYFSFIHRNFPISDENNEPFLSSFRLLNDLTLTPLDAPPGKDDSPEELGLLSFDGLFLETPNMPGGGVCADGSTPGGGDPTDPGFGCPDIFVVDAVGGLTINSVAQLNSLPARSFTREGFQYDIFFELDGLIDLPSDVCNDIAGRANCVGNITTENVSNSADVRLRLEKIATAPEPSSLAGILAAGMIGLGWLGKRKKAE